MISYKSIEKYEIVSFDIFDTLIYRNIDNPTDVFDVVELIFNKDSKNKINQFKKYRIEAELIARKNSKNEEVSLDEIYSNFSKKYNIETCNKLKTIEKDIELNICTKNVELYTLYKKCIKNKKVIITSDMYLPRNLIEKILHSNGFFDYFKLYLSSDILKTKSNGNMYEYIINDLGIDPKKIIHIGDNKKSDYLKPISKGLSAKIYLVKQLKRNGENLTSNIINNVIKNNRKDNYYYNFGFKNLGPLLTGFCKWLNEETKKSDISKLFFLSRDGKIMKTAYDILFNGETHYLYASRRSLIVPSLWKARNYKELFSMMNIPKRIKLKYLLERIGINSIDQNELDSFDLIKEEEYDYESLIVNENFKSFINSRIDRIKENSKREFNSFKDYINKESFNGRLAIVDIGWFGSMQKALIRMLDQEIIGYYLGIHTRRKTQTNNMHGFLFENNKNFDFDNDEYLFNSILEFSFSTFHGSVKCFKNKGEVELYGYEYEGLEEKNYLKNIQKGAIDFVKQIHKLNIIDVLDFNEKESCKRFFETCLYPSYYDSKMLGKISLLDNGINMIGTNKNIGFYLIHPKQFIRDFKKSTWKIGFLKKVVLLPLNYYKVIKVIKVKTKG